MEFQYKFFGTGFLKILSKILDDLSEFYDNSFWIQVTTSSKKIHSISEQSLTAQTNPYLFHFNSYNQMKYQMSYNTSNTWNFVRNWAA